MMTEQEIARHVIGVIPSYRRWVKNNYRKNGRRCVLAAMGELDLTTDERERFISAFYKMTLELFPALEPYRENLAGDSRVIAVNDMGGIHYSDIRVILEKIIARETEETRPSMEPLAPLTVEELVELLDPRMTADEVRALIKVMRLRPCGRRLTGMRGRPVVEYDPQPVMAAHADMVKHVQR